MNEEVINKFLPIIQNHYPTIKKADIEILNGGNHHTVLKIGNQVFRFPKTKEDERNQYAESSFSERFSRISPVRIPIMHTHIDAASGITYQTYEYISGMFFTKEYASSLEKNELLAVAELIGQFLTQLHAIPTKEVITVNQPNTPEEYAQYFLDIIEEDKRVINSLLTPREWEWIEKNSKGYYALSRNHPYALKVTHADLLPKHILIDEETHLLSGIIDFSLRIADPANDFRYFDQYGELFLKTVYENYPARDDYFEERRKFHARDFLVAQLYVAMQKQEPEKQKNHLEELRLYIATHR